MTQQLAKQLTPQQMSEAADLLMRLAHNEKTRPHIAQLIKAVSPQDAKGFQDVFVTQQLAAFKKQLDNERLQERSERATEQRNQQRATVQKARGYSDDQMTELQKIQDNFGFSDWDAAARIYSTHNPPDDPTLKPPKEVEEMGSQWEFPTVPGPDGKMLSFKDYIGNPRKYSNNVAIQMITDFKRGKLPSAFAR